MTSPYRVTSSERAIEARAAQVLTRTVRRLRGALRVSSALVSVATAGAVSLALGRSARQAHVPLTQALTVQLLAYGTVVAILLSVFELVQTRVVRTWVRARGREIARDARLEDDFVWDLLFMWELS
jgi:hypothetical protein